MWSKKMLVAKTLSWSFVGTMLSVIIAWIATGSLTLAGAIAGGERAVKIVFYFFHEYLWNKRKK